MAASLGTFARIWSTTVRHWVLAASAVSWAKAVAKGRDDAAAALDELDAAQAGASAYAGIRSRSARPPRWRPPCPAPRGGRPHYAGGDDHSDRDDAPAAAHLQIGGIDPQIRPVALDRKLRDRDDPILAVSTLGPHQSSRSAPVTMISCDGLI